MSKKSKTMAGNPKKRKTGDEDGVYAAPKTKRAGPTTQRRMRTRQSQSEHTAGDQGASNDGLPSTSSDADLPIYSKPIEGQNTWQQSRDLFDEHVPKDMDAKALLENVHADWLKGPVILEIFSHYTEKQIFDVWRAQGSCTHRSTPAKRKAKMIEEVKSTVDKFRERVKARGKIGSLPLPDVSLWTSSQPVPPASDDATSTADHLSPTVRACDDELDNDIESSSEEFAGDLGASGISVSKPEMEKEDSPVQMTPISLSPAEMDCGQGPAELNTMADIEAEESDGLTEPFFEELDYVSDDSKCPTDWSAWSSQSWMSDGHGRMLADDRALTEDMVERARSPGLPELLTETHDNYVPDPVSLPSDGIELDESSWLVEALARAAEDDREEDCLNFCLELDNSSAIYNPEAEIDL